MSLQSLPIELLSCILRSLDHPDDLLSAITASRLFHAAFGHAPPLFLTSVLRNAIEPEAMPHALAALATIPLARPRCPRADVDRHLVEYFGSCSFAFPSDMPGLITLSRLYNAVSFFIKDYSSRAGHLLSDDAHDDFSYGDSHIQLLSSTERARFQRAFFRYEIYCLSYPCLDPDERSYYGAFTAEQQYGQFLAHLSILEVEEVSCVHVYFASWIAGFIRDIEDEIVIEACQAASEVSKDDSDEVDLVDFRHLDLTRLDFFSKDAGYRTEETLSYIASFGSLSLFDFARAGEVGQRNMIRLCPSPLRHFLPNAIEASPSTEAIMGSITIPEPDAELAARRRASDPTSCIYSGLAAFHRLHESYHIPASPMDGFCALRERAYVFWDSERVLQDSARRKLDEAVRGREEERLLFGDGPRPTVEVRLSRVRVPRADMQRIIDCFGTPEDSEILQMRVTSWQELME